MERASVDLTSVDGNAAVDNDDDKVDAATAFLEGKTEKAKNLLCPITRQLPIYPVSAADGMIYERSAIEKYFEAKMKNRKPVVSPITDKPISTILVDNPALRDVIQSLVDNGGIYGELGANWVRSNNLRKEAEGSLWRAKSGDIVEMVHVAIGCTEGKHGFCKDLKKALDMCKGIEAWAPNGSETQSEKERNSKLKAHAYGIHGRILLSGAGGLDREKSKSLVLLALAAGKGSKPAAKQLGYAYRDGKFGLPRDDELARMLFSMAKRRRLSPKEVAGFKDKMMW